MLSRQFGCGMGDSGGFLAQPPGVRSCRDEGGHQGEGGEWTFCRKPNGGQDFTHMVDALTAGIAQADTDLILAELNEFMRLAEQGRLTFDRGDGGLVCRMRVAEDVLELRVTTHRVGKKVRHVRLYFTEPAADVGSLLAITVTGKPAGQVGLVQQDRDARFAARRFGEHRAWQASQ